jgi:hypothetical protein
MRGKDSKSITANHLSHQKLMIGLEYDNAGAFYHT